MKTLNKQQFAELVLNIYANYLKSYQYDAFYDIKRLRAIEEEDKSVDFHLYFRPTGSDLLFNGDANEKELHTIYIKRNYLVLYVNYIPQVDHSSDIYKVQLIKDKQKFLCFPF